MKIRELPIACSLDGDDQAAQEDDWSRLLAETLIERRSVREGVELKLRPSSETRSRLERLIEAEQRCCPWIEWTVSTGEVLSVEATSGRPEGARVLARWFGVS